MNALIFRGTWSIVKGLLNQAWARVVGCDHRYLRGREEQHFGEMQRCVVRNRARIRGGFSRSKHSRSDEGNSSNTALIDRRAHRTSQTLPRPGPSTSVKPHGQ